MIVTRWQAPIKPTMDQAKLIFRLEGLVPKIETYPPCSKVEEHRHPFDEVRMVISGELLVNVAGNLLLLREGDRITVPSNTRHITEVQGDEECISLYAQKAY